MQIVSVFIPGIVARVDVGRSDMLPIPLGKNIQMVICLQMVVR
jgi:hypothetical protein